MVTGRPVVTPFVDLRDWAMNVCSKRRVRGRRVTAWNLRPRGCVASVGGRCKNRRRRRRQLGFNMNTKFRDRFGAGVRPVRPVSPRPAKVCLLDGNLPETPNYITDVQRRLNYLVSEPWIPREKKEKESNSVFGASPPPTPVGYHHPGLIGDTNVFSSG